MTATGKNQLQDLHNDYVAACPERSRRDAAGNLIQPGPIGGPYVFDAENHLVSAGGMAYLYDGDGKRVGKAPASTPTQPNYLYWYGTGSDILEETDGAGNYLYSDFYFNGLRLARGEYDNWVDHFFSDALGNVRVVYGDNDPDGGSSDYYPFGGERPVTNGGVNVPFQFTGKERDAESGLDDFDARYYSSSIGRFMIPDWAAKPTAVPYAKYGNPQSLNLYSYVENNPTSVTDPNGHGDATGGYCDANRCYSSPADVRNGTTMGEAALQGLGMGALAAGIFSSPAAAGSVFLRNLLGLGLATAPRTVPLIADAVEGYVNPGSPGSLTISSATRLSEQEISTGVRLANQTGQALAESGHVGEEFVSAAGKTYDAMGGGKAFEHFGNGGQFFDSIVSHVNKSVDQVAIDLKGASKGQVGAIKDFVKTLTKTQQKKIIYVQ